MPFSLPLQRSRRVDIRSKRLYSLWISCSFFLAELHGAFGWRGVRTLPHLLRSCNRFCKFVQSKESYYCIFGFVGLLTSLEFTSGSWLVELRTAGDWNQLCCKLDVKRSHRYGLRHVLTSGMLCATSICDCVLLLQILQGNTSDDNLRHAELERKRSSYSRGASSRAQTGESGLRHNIGFSLCLDTVCHLLDARDSWSESDYWNGSFDSGLHRQVLRLLQSVYLCFYVQEITNSPFRIMLL